VIAGVDVGGDAGYAVVRAGFALGCLFRRLSGDLTLRAQTRGPSGAVQAREDGGADVAGIEPGIYQVLLGGTLDRRPLTLV
jgi:hypothetical protein